MAPTTTTSDDLGSNTHAKRCFVTIGATASFDRLLKAVFHPTFLQALHDADYTELRVQYGKEGQTIFDEFVKENADLVKDRLKIKISGFGFDATGLAKEMQAAKSPVTKSGTGAREGAVISHAGTGTILDAMRYGVPLLVVPNTDLLHNHQVELAEELARLDYVVHGNLDDLPAAIPELEQLRTRMQKWPPVNSGVEKYEKGLATVMDEEMGWVD